MNTLTSSSEFTLSLSTTNNVESKAESIVAGKTANDRFAARPSYKTKSASIKFSANKFVTQRYDCFSEHYEIVELLGEGAYGEVYVCKHRESGAERAVKILQVEDEEDAEVVLSEFNILRGIDHPNLLKIYQLYEDEESGKFYIVSDLYQGGELYDGKDSSARM
jgi:calcium-dependent protein kinase